MSCGIHFYMLDGKENIEKVSSSIKEKIHIYLDSSSIPSLLQLINIIKKPKNESKIILWNRLRNDFSKKLLVSYSAEFIDENQNTEVQVLKFIQKNENKSIVFHYNILNKSSEELLNKIIDSTLPERIHSVHIYEDAPSYTWWNKENDIKLKKKRSYPLHIICGMFLT